MSFSTGPSSSPSRDFHADSDEEGEEPLTQASVDRENSFEDLEQFLTQLDWTPPNGSAEDATEPTCDPSTLSEGHVQGQEMRALKEHLKATMKDIHIAIGEPAPTMLIINTSVC